MTRFLIELGSPGRPPARHTVERPMIIGREGDIVVDDEQVSRRHAVVDPTDGGLRLDDLGSSNGTYVNGERATSPRVLSADDVVMLGRTTLRVLPAVTTATPPTSAMTTTAPSPPHPPESSLEPSAPAAAGPSAAPPTPPAPTPPPPSPAPTPPAPTPPAPPSPAPTPPPPSPAPPPSQPSQPPSAAGQGGPPGGLTSIERDGVEVRFRPDTAGERAAADVLSAAVAARRHLAGLGSEAWGVPVRISLVDPFPDPEQPTLLVSEGTVVNAADSEVWMVVTDHTDVEPVGRALALVFGDALPARDELAPYLEGYGLIAGDAPDTTAELRGRKLPAFTEAAGDLAAAMSVSFVRFLLARGGGEAFRRFLGSARPGRLDEAAREVYGSPRDQLEAEWRASLLGRVEEVRPGAFLRLSLTYIRPHLRRQIEIFVYLLMSLAFTTAMPFVTKRLLDTALPSGEWSQISRLMLVLAGAFAISLVAQLRQRYLSTYVSSSIVRSIRTSMFERMQHLSAGWYSRHDQGDVMSRFFSDVTMLEQGLTSMFRDGLFQILSLIVAIVVAFTLDWRLAVIVLVGAPVIGVVYRRLADGAMRRSMAMQERTGEAMSVTAENFQAQQVVKAFGLAAREVTRFRRVSDRLFESEMKMTVYVGWFMLSVQVIVTVLRIAVMTFGGWLILEGHLTIGTYVAFLGVMGQVLEPVTGLTTLGQDLQQSMGALARVEGIMNEAPEVRDASDAQPIAPLRDTIRIEGVTFGYTPERTVLEDVDLVIPAGRRTAIVGPSGSGKSSILQLITRAYDPDRGRVTWDGLDLVRSRLDDLRSQIGVVFQDTFAFDDTIRENIRLGRLDATDAEVEHAARQAELHDFVLGLPNGYDTVIGERGSLLSGGQRQRLAIARALLRNPSLLVLDEATSALDPRTERLIAGTLDRVSANRTTVAVTHRLLTVVDYDQIAVVVDGRIAETGTHRELLARGGVYAALWAEQGGAAAPETPVIGPGGGRRLSRMTGVLRPLPLPTGPAVSAPDLPARATGTFGAVN